MDRKVVIMDTPLIQHKLSILRDVDTSTMEFRELVNEIAMLMMYDATRDLPLEDKQVTTPCGVADCKVLAGRKLAFVPILRAGLGMVDGALRLVPAARVGHIGLYRNEETLEPVESNVFPDVNLTKVYVPIFCVLDFPEDTCLLP